jgi:glycosidase
MTRFAKWLLIILLALVCVAAAERESEVYYQIFVRSFQDTTGDGIGDLQGVVARLDYLESLGVTGLWLLPIHPSPSYHGYDVTDYYAIHPDYGTLEDFEALLAAAHGRGIKVVLDLVVNHTSSRHPWFVAARQGDPVYRDYYVWREDNPTWRGTLGGPAWHRNADGHYYLGLFWGEMPDLNFRNPEVVARVNEIARFWLELGVRGFRIDAIQHIVESEDGIISNTPETLAWVRDFQAFVKSVREDAFLFGETWTDSEMIARYHREAKLDMSANYPLYFATVRALQRRNARDLVSALEQMARLYPPEAVSATFVGNHDHVRLATTLGFLRRDEARLRMAAGLLFTLPGVPFIYYGEELGMPNGPGERDEEKRTPMRWDESERAGFTAATPWHPFSTDDPAISVAAQETDPDSLLNWYRKLIALRHARAALAHGETAVLATGDPALLAFVRELPGERLLVLANLANQERSVDLVALAGLEHAHDLIADEPVGGEAALAPMQLRVLARP